ncbi:MAG TPA: nitroreductase family protein [Dehalococcoidia bacterium]|nr:nitroreductase family protein [Dehalococcoidia bacterium]
MIRDLVLQNRSYRRFYQDVSIDTETMREFVDLARLCPSAANRQALKYIISNDPETNAKIYPHVRIDNNPPEGERPSAYVIILEDTEIGLILACDYGIVAQTIHLAAVEKGFGGCMIGNIIRDDLRKALDIPEKYNILLILALGKPIETMVIEDQSKVGVGQQWWDKDRVRHVPKRPLDEVLLT